MRVWEMEGEGGGMDVKVRRTDHLAGEGVRVM